MTSTTDDAVYALRADDKLVITWMSGPLASLWPSEVGRRFGSHLSIPDEHLRPLVSGALHARHTGQPVNVGDYLIASTTDGIVVFIHPDGLATLA